MNDQSMAGSSWRNPQWYRGWRLYRSGRENPHEAVLFVHKDYAGAMDDDEPTLIGAAFSFNEAEMKIDCIERDKR